MYKLPEKLNSQLMSHYQKESPDHDHLHIKRVVKMCRELAKNREHNEKVLITAAYLHDIINIPKDHPRRSEASSLAAKKAQEVLKEYEYNREEIEHISQVILEHSFSANLKASSVESEILQDADKLDAMGAIGVMRWSSCGARMKARFYEENDPWGEKRELDDKSYSLDHFEKKLLKLESHLNTQMAKEIGKRRMAFFRHFLEELKLELID